MSTGRPIRLLTAAGLIVGVASALLRFQAFSQSPYANGWDGYFYLVQIRAWVETGRMHSPEASLIYPLLRFWLWCTGDYVLMYQCCAAALAGIFTAVVLWMALSRPRAWLLGSWALFSPQLTYFAAQYPKNLLGLVLLLAFIGSLPRITAQQKPVRFILPFILLIFNYFGHRMTFGLAVVYLLTWGLLSLKTVTGWRMINGKSLALAGLAIGLFAVAGSLWPGLPQVADLGRLAGGWQWPPQFAPWSFISQFGQERLSSWWLLEIVAVTAFFLFELVKTGWIALRRGKAIRQPDKQHALLLLCALLLFPFAAWSFTSAAYRFWLVFMLLAPLTWAVGNQNPAQDSSYFQQRDRWPYLGVSIVLSIAAFFSWKSYLPARHDPNYALFARVTGHTADRLGLPSCSNPPELVIAHNALAEFFTFTTGLDAMPWLPEYPIDSARLWRIAAGMHLPTVRYFAGADQAERVQPLSSNYCLLPESVWQHCLTRARAEGDSVYLAAATGWLNPSRERPKWLLNKKL